MKKPCTRSQPSFAYDCVLLIRLDALGYDTEFHCLAERNDRLHDARVGFGVNEF